MSGNYLENLTRMSDEEAKSLVLPGRRDTLELLRERPRADVVIAGDGLLAAELAHRAALHRLRTVLLCPVDYGDALASPAPELVLEETLPWWRLRARRSEHREYAKFVEALGSFGRWCEVETHDLAGGEKVARRHGAVVDMHKLTLQVVLAARQEGALCLNHAAITHLFHDSGGTTKVRWTDAISRSSESLETGVVIIANEQAFPNSIAAVPRLPLDGRPQATLGWHVPEARLERPVWCRTENAKNIVTLIPAPSGGLHVRITGECDVRELRHIFDRFDVPHPPAPHASLRLAPERREWRYERGFLVAPTGVSYQSLREARKGTDALFRIAEISVSESAGEQRPLPGVVFHDSKLPEIEKGLHERGVPRDAAARVLRVWGTRGVRLFELPEGTSVLEGGPLRGEIELAVQLGQATSARELFVRRLDLENDAIEAARALAETHLTKDVPGYSV